MTRALLIGDGEVRYKKFSVFAPFEQFADVIAQTLDLSWELVWIDPAAPALPSEIWPGDFDCAFVQDLALKRLPALEALSLPKIFVDTEDSTVLNRIETFDTYAGRLKGQLLRDRDGYRTHEHGERWFARALNDLYGLAQEPPSAGKLSVTADRQLVLGWNCGIMDRTHGLIAAPSAEPRPIDVCFRGKVGQHAEWYTRHRQDVVARLRTLADTFTVVAETERLNTQKYVAELRRSKLCVSPYGFGEICIRDFEAVAAGCVLLKPDMSRVETAPDLFVAHETYVPFALDGSDLVDVCRDYLARPDDCARIAHNARAAYLAYLAERRYLEPIRRALALL